MSSHRLVLVGGGHTHVLVLRALGLRPDELLRVTVVSPARHATYSGMVPGAIAGQYRLADAQIDLNSLAARAHQTSLAAAVAEIDRARQCLRLSDGTELPYDYVSFDTGSQPARTAVIEAGAPLVALKPMDSAIARLHDALAAPAPARGRRIVVVGAGAAGAEVSLALAARLRDEPAASVTLCGDAAQPVLERGPRTTRLVARALDEHRIAFVGGARVVRVTAHAVCLEGGRELGADLVVWATGAGGTKLFADAGLPVDQRGFLQVGDELRCVDHANIFAAGDCAALIPYPDLPKAGVFAVREAPILDHNLRAAARGETLRRYRPQRRFLALLNTCDRQAVLSYGALAWRGRAAWLLKDYIDRGFIAQFR
jgi:selenide,water dikinase